jgi:hypothetical protein
MELFFLGGGKQGGKVLLQKVKNLSSVRRATLAKPLSGMNI